MSSESERKQHPKRKQSQATYDKTQSDLPPKDGARAWVTTAAFFLIIFLNFGNARLLGMFFEEWRTEFGVPRSQSSWMTATAFLMIGLGSPMATFLFGILPPSTVVFLAGILTSAGFVGLSFVESFAGMVVMNLLTFTGSGIIITTTYICVSQWSDKYRPMTIGFGNMGSPVAGMALPRLFEFLKLEFGWRGVFFVAGGLFLNNCVAALLLRRYPTPPKTGSAAAASKAPRFDLSIFRLNLFLFLPIYCLLHLGCMNGFLAFQPSMATELGLSDTDKANVLICLGTSDLIARLVLSLLVTWPRVRRHLAWLLFLNELLMALGSLWVGFATDFGTLVGGSIVFGLSYGGWYVFFFSFLAEVATPRQLPVAVGACYTGGGMSSLLIPPFAGFISDSVGQYTVVFYFFAALLVFAAATLIFVVFLQRKRDQYRHRVKEIALSFIDALALKDGEVLLK